MMKRVFHMLQASLAFLSVSASPGRPLIPRSYDLTEIEVDASKHDTQFFSFVTRPDLDTPRLNVTVYDETALAPGYLFLSPYTIVAQTDNDKLFVGPHIYDQAGNLIWSGVAPFDGWNVFDFRVASVDAEGEDVITSVHPHSNRAVILDNTYEVYADIDIGVNKQTNMHSFMLVDNGTRGLYMTKQRGTADLHEEGCEIDFIGIQERVISTGEITFEWSSEDHIPLEESTMYTGQIPESCSSHWDYVHSNALVKLPDGDYLMSGRHTYTVYKISSTTGEIVWRFGGKKTDFAFDGHFSGQHDVQYLFQNSTHLLISMLDNAYAPGVPHITHPFSRGLQIWINTEKMTAEYAKIINHPYQSTARGRGNLQTLPNGNALLAWGKETFVSEHTPDGEMIMEISIPSGLKSYRAFKFPWIGRPSAPPDVHSEVSEVGNHLVTTVHVSWNGDTEVASWTLYRMNADGSVMEAVVDAVQRRGFETVLTYAGCARFVAVVGSDRHGHRLGVSRVVSTLGFKKYESHPTAMKESQWLLAHPDAEGYDPQDGINTPTMPAAWEEMDESMDIVVGSPRSMLFGIGFIITALFSAWFVRRIKPWWRKRPLYTVLSHEDEEDLESFKLRP